MGRTGKLQTFFASPYAFRVIRNTLVINLMDLVFGFPVPIIFALLLNEVRNNKVKRTIQTFTYLPHFISVVVVVGMMNILLSPTDGLVNKLIVGLGGNSINFLVDVKWFRWLYVLSNIWQNFGWDSIIYFAAIAGINAEIYEAAMVDGAGRWKKDDLYYTAEYSSHCNHFADYAYRMAAECRVRKGASHV